MTVAHNINKVYAFSLYGYYLSRILIFCLSSIVTYRYEHIFNQSIVKLHCVNSLAIMFGCVAPDTTQWGKLQLYSCIVSSKQLFLTL